MNSPNIDFKVHPKTRSYTHSQAQLFLNEVTTYLQHYPETSDVDIFLHDLNGHIRGKRIDINSLKGLSKGCYFPLSVYAMSLDGKVVEEAGIGKHIGEPDQLCTPILGTLQPSALHPTTHAQLFLSMKEEDGSDCPLEPRNILKKILNQFHQADYFPVMTAELEFFLYKATNDDGSQNILPSQCFDLDALDQNQQILEEIKTQAGLQSIEIISIVAESAQGQYELNIQHSRDILKLADQIMALKRIVKQVAQQHQLLASFMAKPSMHQAGSGLHFHMSLLNQQHDNLFSLTPQARLSTTAPIASTSTAEGLSVATDQTAPLLLKALAGLIELMPASMAILAPNINSFRRFKMGNHVPMEANWGSNNRNVAIRLPCSDQQNKRFEYRVAGADANPYLALSIILIGVWHGIHHDLVLPPPSQLMKLNDQRRFLPNNQLDALQLFKNHPILNQYLGSKFVELWYTCKLSEYQTIHNQITSMELKWGI
ncbi:glutamate--putrescine ligase [Acinetobacter calcoaceticus]|uniref:Glutamate--putrescine ligase n=1 Tax=Acinetobacter calcoaceticus TaxID=471 RepID=A0A4R1XIK5_ACICA|nr:glutamate--putrescine ligase [Acinetobacter calcoaceticus]